METVITRTADGSFVVKRAKVANVPGRSRTNFSFRQPALSLACALSLPMEAATLSHEELLASPAQLRSEWKPRGILFPLPQPSSDLALSTNCLNHASHAYQPVQRIVDWRRVERTSTRLEALWIHCVGCVR